MKAVGIALKEKGIVQVSINVTDFAASPLHVVLQAVREKAHEQGVKVRETEVYGMVPAAALLASATHCLQIAGFDDAQVLDLRLLDMQG